MSAQELVDREREVRELRGLAEADGPQMALLYGRRRVGKTFLLQHAWDEANVFYFLAGDVTSEQNRRDLLRELSDWSDGPVEVEDYPNWRMTFRRLFGEAAGDSAVIVLDEFQYLLGESDKRRREVTSQLNAIWDGHVEGRGLDLTVVLCGSEIGVMEGLGASGPLYGRITWRHRLEPFDYFDAAKMLEHVSLRERVYFYAILGGVPEYLDAIGERGVREAVIETILSPRGEVHFQLERLLQQEQGLREPRKYRAVLQAVASGCTETNEIKQQAFGGGTAHRVRRILGTLEELGLVRRERNFRAGRKAAWRNRVADPAVAFWYRFVHPNRSQLEAGHLDRVWSQRIEPQLDTYTGRVFERIVGEAFHRRHADWGFPAPSDWGRWEGTDRNRQSVEVDIVSELDDESILTGEVKWSSSPVAIDLHFEHRHKLQSLADSGEKWAHEALDPERSGGRLYVSAAGFDEAFRERAAEEGWRLVRLEELYESRRGQ